MIVIGTDVVEGYLVDHAGHKGINRLVAAVQYRAGALAIRFFGSHAEYDRIDAETV